MMMVHNNATFGDDSTDRSTTPPCPCVVPSCPKRRANTTAPFNARRPHVCSRITQRRQTKTKKKQKNTSETSAEDGTRATTQQQPTATNGKKSCRLLIKRSWKLPSLIPIGSDGMQSGVMGPGSDRCHQPRHHTVAYPFPRPSTRLLVRQKTSAAASIMKYVRVCDMLFMNWDDTKIFTYFPVHALLLFSSTSFCLLWVVSPDTYFFLITRFQKAEARARLSEFSMLSVTCSISDRTWIFSLWKNFKLPWAQSLQFEALLQMTAWNKI